MSQIRRAPVGVDVAALEAELERRVAERATVPDPPEVLPAFLGADADPLARARWLVGRPGVAYEIGWRTPLLGQAWAGLRELIHGEARRYVDALMARQAELDAALLDEVTALHERVARLEARLADPDQRER
jgi:hypothetical protein